MFPKWEDCICYPLIKETFYYQDEVSLLASLSDFSTVGVSDFSTVGGRIKYYRLLKSLSQKELSVHSGIDRASIIDYENNRVVPNLELCNKIAVSLDINPSLLYDDYLSFLASNFGEKILLLRKSLGLTQKQFAKVLGVMQGTISCWEKEQKYPSRDNYKKVYIIEGKNQMD